MRKRVRVYRAGQAAETGQNPRRSSALGALAAAVALGAAVLAALRTRRRVLQHFEADVAARRPLGAEGVVIGAESLEFTGSATHAVLILHGFGDTPQSTMPLAQALHRAGWTVSVPLLPGHGRSLREFAAVRHPDWIDAVQGAYDALAQRHDTVAVCGISMGAALAVLLAASHTEVPALALLAPYLAMPRAVQAQSALARLTGFAYPYRTSTGGARSIHDATARAASLGMGVVTPGLLAQLRDIARRAQRALPAVRAPTLYLQSREDNRIPQRTAIEQFARLGSAVKEQRWLTGCGHIITVDYCKEQVAAQVIEWFAPLLRPALRSPA